MIGGIEQPGVTGIGGEKDQWADGHQAPIVFGRAALDVVDLVGEFEILAVYASLSWSAFDDSPAQGRAPFFG
jgi:hypothetical protein